MILKNKALLIYDFLTAPAEKIYERADRFYFKELNDVLIGKTPLGPQHTPILGLFPEVAAALGARALQNPAVAALIKASPMAALRLLLTSYETLAPTLEPVVLNSAETTYYLLKASRDLKLTLANPPETYLLTLLKDPFWALRWYGDTQDESVLARCLKVGTNPSSSPEAAYVHLYFNTDVDPSDLIEVLSQNSFYAYLSSRHFYDRGAEFKMMDLRGLTPRWAYHFITDGFLDDEDGLIDTMLHSPDWLVEYLVESERYKDLAYTGGLFEKASAKCQGNLQMIYFKLWWERVQAYVKKNPPPPSKSSAKSS